MPTDETSPTTTRRTVGVLLTESEWRDLEAFAARSRRSISNATSLLLAAALASEPTTVHRRAA